MSIFFTPVRYLDILDYTKYVFKKISIFLHLIYVSQLHATSTIVENDFYSKLNSKCDHHLGEQLELKKDCLERTYEGACFNLAAMIEYGSITAGAGAGLALAAFLKTKPTEFQKNYENAVKVMRNYRDTLSLVQKEYLNALDEKLKVLSKGAVNSRENLLPTPKNEALLNKAEIEVSAEFKLKYKNDPLKSDALTAMTGDSGANSAYYWQIQLSKIFPEQDKKLGSLYEQKKSIWSEYSNKTISHQEFLAKNHALDLNYKKILSDAGSDQKILLRLYNSMYTHINPSASVLSEQQALSEAAKFKAKQNRNFNIKPKRYAAAGAVLGGLAETIATEHLSGLDITRCTALYGFTDKDLLYLNSFFTRAKNTTDYDCKNLSLNDPKKTFSYFYEKEGKIPASICKLADAMNKRYDGFLLQDVVIKKADCTSVETSDFSLNLDYSKNPVFEGNSGYPIISIQQGNFTVKMPTRFGLRGFRFVKYFDQNGKEVLNKSLAIQDFYNKVSHSPTYGSSTRVQDLAGLIEKDNSHNGNTFRRLAKALNKSYVFIDAGSIICPHSYYDQTNPSSKYALKQTSAPPVNLKPAKTSQ